MGGFHLGNLLGLLLSPIMLSTMGISGPFVLFSAIGMLWVTRWVSSVTNDPRDSPFVTESELRLIQAGKSIRVGSNGKFPPLKLLLSKLPTWAIIFSNAINNWVSFPPAENVLFAYGMVVQIKCFYSFLHALNL